MAVVFETLRRQVAIAGTVKDRVTGKPLQGAEIVIVSGPGEFSARMAMLAGIHGKAWNTMAPRPDRTFATADGHFHFMDLPDGDYGLEARLPRLGSRYGKAEKTVSVARTAQGSVVLTASDMLLPPSTVKGRILRQGTSTPVVMAEIRVGGSLEFCFSDENGDYRLPGLESSAARPRSLSVSAAGFQPKTLEVYLPSPGNEVIVNVQIAPL